MAPPRVPGPHVRSGTQRHLDVGALPAKLSCYLLYGDSPQWIVLQLLQVHLKVLEFCFPAYALLKKSRTLFLSPRCHPTCYGLQSYCGRNLQRNLPAHIACDTDSAHPLHCHCIIRLSGCRLVLIVHAPRLCCVHSL